MKISIIETLGFALMTSTALAGKNKVRLHECPENVRNVITQKMQGGKLDEIKFVNLRGKTVYVAEVDFRKDREMKIYVLEDGTLMKISEEIRLVQAPAAVREALFQLQGEIDDLEIERATVDGMERLTYHAEIDRKGAPDVDVVVSNTGEIISQQDEARD